MADSKRRPLLQNEEDTSVNNPSTGTGGRSKSYGRGASAASAAKQGEYQLVSGSDSGGVPSAPGWTPSGYGGGGGGRSNPNGTTNDGDFVLQNTGVVDTGFKDDVGFDKGSISERFPEKDFLRMIDFQERTCMNKLCSFLGVTASALSVVGIPYLVCKLTLVKKGNIGLSESVNGSVSLLYPGWHLFSVVNTRVRKFDMNDKAIHFGTLTIIRIMPGEIGIAEMDGSPVVLHSGRHCINDPLFKFIKRMPVTEQLIEHNNIHIITVPKNAIGLCYCDGVPHFLESGRHIINNSRFVFQGFVDATKEHIALGSKHRIIVPAGKIGLGVERGESLFLEAGTTYNICSSTFRFEKFANATDEHVSLGARHRIIVPAGKIGLGFKQGEALFFNPGEAYNIVDPTFIYKGSRFLTEPVIEHGSLQIVMVRDGSWGISYDEGTLSILNRGRHILDKPTHNFSGFLASGQTTLSISSVTSLSSDNVGLTFDAAINIQIVDAKKAVTMLAGSEEFSPKKIYDNIVQQAKLALSIIIGNNRLNSAFRSTTRCSREEAEDVGPQSQQSQAAAGRGGNRGAENVNESDVDPSGGADPGSFKQHIHDIFMASFSRSMAEENGVKVIDMSIEDIKITNEELASAMARGAVARTQLDKAKVDVDIMRTNAEADQQAEIARAEGTAKSMGIIAEAEAKRIRQLDDAMRDVCEVTAQREIIRAGGEVIGKTKSTLLLANNVANASYMLGNTMRGINEDNS